MGSTRFPGKMTEELGGYPLLRWVLERTRRAASLDRVVLCTSDLSRDTVLADLARDYGIPAFRGAEEDVLGRFAAAAREHGAGTVVRVCADNPLIAPEAIDRLVAAYVAEGPDYAFNHVPMRGSEWPDGLGAEVLGADLLARLARDATAPRHREHATSFILDNPDTFRILAVACPAAWRHRGDPIRLDVDTPADLKALRSLCGGLEFGATPDEILTRWRLARQRG